MTLSFACAVAASVSDKAAPARMAAVNFLMISSLRPAGASDLTR
jgi:hypothetical protein